MKKFIVRFSVAIFTMIILVSISEASTLEIKNKSTYSRLKGKIILKVEDKGKAYYINPGTESMHYLGRPNDAFNVMREQGIGISNSNLKKIPIGLSNLTGSDLDGDGLPDMLEDAIGTDKSNRDTDGDGYNDKEELIFGYSPTLKLEKNEHDLQFTKSNLGKIFLQVEGNGEAWYLSPGDGMRYFLGRPVDAFNVMREMGLGISNNDFTELSNGSCNDGLCPYESQGYKLNFKYPVGWSVVESEDSLKISDPADLSNERAEGGYYSIILTKNNEYKSIKEIRDHLDEINQKNPNCITSIEEKTIQFKNTKVEAIEYIECGMSASDSISWVVNNSHYALEYSTNKKNVDSIISEMVFLDIDDNSSDILANNDSWVKYEDKDNFRISFLYPSNLNIKSTLDQEVIELKDEKSAENPYFAFYLNSDGHGPYFPNKIYNLKEEDGQLSIESIEQQEISENHSESRILIRGEGAEYKNNKYDFSLNYTVGGEDYEQVFKEIIKSINFIDTNLVHIDNLWNLYTNSQYSFSMKIPKKNNASYDCGPIVVNEEANSIKIINGKEKMINSVLTGEQFDACAGGWNIYLKKVKSEEEINGFLTEIYSQECVAVKEEEDSNNNLVNYGVEKCNTGGGVHIKYSPEHSVVAVWSTGQDRTYVLPNDVTADVEMVDSFKFLN